ncbi:loc398523 partial [Stylonychia lemnae]|uniref:Loc398523 partial n=1 Tax=Stylonychia lemnae TaxID=5949 RepID=A0A078B3N1_STYLE|nr:loc398523 partial [Stylonychia lemnae]
MEHSQNQTESHILTENADNHTQSSNLKNNNQTESPLQGSTEEGGNSQIQENRNSNPEDATASNLMQHSQPKKQELESASKDEALVEEEEEEDEDDVKTLSQLYVECQNQEKLQIQLSKNELTKKCRYQDGYIYQQVYSCLTCYIELIKQQKGEFNHDKIFEEGLGNQKDLIENLKPHGFCLGCMLHCHENHEVIELYSKLDFRCDCGNGRMPFSCQLNDNKEDYENEKNYYNHNFLDSYCYCKKPHTFEIMDQFMIQCYDCEDWFHNQHLTPALQDQLDDQYFLLCKDCVARNYLNVIAQYQQFWHETSLNYFGSSAQLEPPSKRTKLTDRIDSKQVSHQKVNCQEQDVNGSLVQQGFDLIIDEKMIKYICDCQNCSKIFSKLKRHIQVIENMNEQDRKLLNNLDGNINEDGLEEEKQQPVNESTKKAEEISNLMTSDDYINQMMKKAFSQQSKPLSHEGQIHFAENYAKFKDYFVAFLKQFEENQRKITLADVNQFKEGLNMLQMQREKPQKYE